MFVPSRFSLRQPGCLRTDAALSVVSLRKSSEIELRLSRSHHGCRASNRKGKNADLETGNLLEHDNLENFDDPDRYDIEAGDDAGVAFYTALARETGGPILELACGTGRVSIPIARMGFAVTGLDIVPGMLDLARRKSIGLPVRWIEGDARTFGLGEQFRLVFLTGNAFQAFLRLTDQEAMLERVSAHLSEDGLFAFETRNPRWSKEWSQREVSEGLFAELEDREEEECGNYVNDKGHLVCVSRMQRYDHVAQILHWTTYRRWRDDDGPQTQVSRIAVRFTFSQELSALLHYNGFTVLRQYGDWDLSPLTAASRSIISVCSKHA
jgi:SAM-dependent methyltransferase